MRKRINKIFGSQYFYIPPVILFLPLPLVVFGCNFSNIIMKTYHVTAVVAFACSVLWFSKSKHVAIKCALFIAILWYGIHYVLTLVQAVSTYMTN